MKINEFYQKYANTPLEERFGLVNVSEFGLMSLDMIYGRLKELEEIMSPFVIERDKILSKLDWYYLEKEENK